MVENLLVVKSKDFALGIVKTYRHLQESGERVLSRQLLRAGTSIGANIAEGQYAQSKADFLTKYTIALKEASESAYWIDLLQEAGYLSESKSTQTLKDECSELIRLLVSSVKKLKGINKNE